MAPRISREAKAENRERLLQAAADHFAAHGLEGANINDISLAAGLAKGTVYNHFPSKEALFLAVIEETCARGIAEVALPEGDTRHQLEALARADVDWVRRNEAFARVFMRELFTAHAERYQAVLEATAPTLDLVVRVLERGVERGEVRSDEPVLQQALAFTGLLTMAYVQHWGTGGWPTFDEIPAAVSRFFLEGAAPRPAPAE